MILEKEKRKMLNQKKISKTGGITIPSHLRREYGIEAGENFKIEADKNGDITLKRIVGSCIICSNNENLIEINGKYVCHDCLESLNTLAVVDVKEGIEE